MAATTERLTLDTIAAAKLVRREVPVLNKNHQPTGKTKKVALHADEVFAFKDYGDYVVVVTIDGKKLRGDKK